MNLILGTAMLLGSLLEHGMIGEVTYYGPGVMERVYANRLRWGHVEECSECIGMVALLERQHVGKRVFLQRLGRNPEGPFLVVDCAAQKDLRRLQKRGLVAEVDWRTARRWGMRGPVYDVRIVFSGAPIVRQEGVKKGGNDGD